jgi:CheY-like chemotaxis protein
MIPRDSMHTPEYVYAQAYREVMAEFVAMRSELRQLLPIVGAVAHLQSTVDRLDSAVSGIKSYMTARESEGKGYRNGLEGLRLLIVEDDPGLSAVWQREFEKCGVICCYARTAEDAETKLAELQPGYLNSALIDLNLPHRRNGFEVATLVRMDHPHCRIVIVTGGETLGIIREAQDIGAVTAEKPIDFGRLKALVAPDRAQMQ